MKTTARQMAFVILFASSTAAGNAAVVMYDENVSGDLADSGHTYLGTLGAGTNTVSGAIIIDDSGADFDGFSFALDAGTRLDAISLSFTHVATPGVAGANGDYWLRALGNPDTLLDSETVNFLGLSPVSMFTAALPLGPGDYGVEQVAIDRLCLSLPCSSAVNYSWSLTVSVLPEPGSLALFAAVFAVLGITGGQSRFWR